jgi:hypothetical protein
MTINPAASAKLDQAGKAALDAIYAERTFGGPELAPVMVQFNRGEIPKDDFMRIVKNHFGDSPEGQRKLITFAIDQLQVSEKRKRAVAAYVDTRQLIESLTSA